MTAITIGQTGEGADTKLALRIDDPDLPDGFLVVAMSDEAGRRIGRDIFDTVNRLKGLRK
jgi:hypothetical protein